MPGTILSYCTTYFNLAVRPILTHLLSVQHVIGRNIGLTNFGGQICGSKGIKNLLFRSIMIEYIVLMDNGGTYYTVIYNRLFALRSYTLYIIRPIE